MPMSPVDGEFFVNPLNRPFAEGRSTAPAGRNQGGGYLGLLLLLTPFLWVGVGEIATVATSATIRMHLAEDGRPARAVVLDLIVHEGDEGASSHAVVYRFVPPGWRDEPHRQGISAATYQGLRVGGELDVVYSPSHPGSVLPAANNSWEPVFKRGMFALLWNGLLLPFIFIVVGAAVREFVITRWSRPCRGRLKAIAVELDDEGHRRVLIDYTFTTPDGRALTDRWAGPCAVHDDELPAPGARLAVAYAGRWGHDLL